MNQSFTAILFGTFLVAIGPSAAAHVITFDFSEVVIADIGIDTTTGFPVVVANKGSISEASRSASLFRMINETSGFDEGTILGATLDGGFVDVFSISSSATWIGGRGKSTDANGNGESEGIAWRVTDPSTPLLTGFGADLVDPVRVSTLKGINDNGIGVGSTGALSRGLIWSETSGGESLAGNYSFAQGNAITMDGLNTFGAAQILNVNHAVLWREELSFLPNPHESGQALDATDEGLAVAGFGTFFDSSLGVNVNRPLVWVDSDRVVGASQSAADYEVIQINNADGSTFEGGTTAIVMVDDLWFAGGTTSTGAWVMLETWDEPMDYEDFLTMMGGASSATAPSSITAMVYDDVRQRLHLVSANNYVGLDFAPSLTADFDSDGDVDGNDLAQWEGDFGLNGMSDADSDGDSDGADFLAWQRQFSSSAPQIATLQAVPEPTSLIIIGIGIGVATFPTSRRWPPLKLHN